MSISHSDFYRLLPRAVVGREFQISPPQVTVIFPGGMLTITLNEESIHQIASLKLPSTNVQFEFDNVSDEDIVTFFQQFEISFRRGGG